ncbi:MAG: hypothetical protein HY649_07870 [Acidobacteria bacterium]|nr:hypothetical protein [Acidobacteriota bacterium]
MENKVCNTVLGMIFSIIVMVPFAQSQTEVTESQPQTATAKEPSKAAEVQAGTKVMAELESTLDARKAKPGDEVKAKVTQDVKQDGRTVIRKGDSLVGRVKSVEASSKNDAGSNLSVEFDRLVQGKTSSELRSAVSAILPTSKGPSAEPVPMRSPESVMPSSPPVASGRSSGGSGLLGGLGSTVQSTVGLDGSATNTVGGSLEAASRGTLDTGTGMVAPLVRLDSQGQAEQQASGSVFRTDRGNLRLESGTHLEFHVVGQGETTAQSQ